MTTGRRSAPTTHGQRHEADSARRLRYSRPLAADHPNEGARPIRTDHWLPTLPAGGPGFSGEPTPTQGRLEEPMEGCMIARPCLDCPGYATKNGRCDACRSRWNAARNARPSRSIYLGRWRATSQAVRASQPWCSRCYRTSDLTVDHGGGVDGRGGLAVLCRPCHSRIEAERRAQTKAPASLMPGPQRF